MAARVLVELSASERDNQRRFGCSVAESVVRCYAMAQEADACGDALTVAILDVANAELERVAQLGGALIDAGCSVIRFRDVGEREAELRLALQRARIADDRIEIR